MRMDKNAEGYPDPTAGQAYKNIVKEERAKAYAEEKERFDKISSLIPILRATAELAGFDILGRIPLKDRETGKEYR